MTRELKPYDSDHTALVHVLWAIDGQGLSLKDFDQVAAVIMRSHWLKAVRAHAAEKALASKDKEQS